MSNYAALVSPLSISGSRLTDGSANASGVVYFFQPGTNTTVNVYSNVTATTVVTQPVTLGAGGKLPTQYSGGIFTTQPVRVLIQDASGNTVTDNVFIPASAGNVGVSNSGFTDSTLNDVLSDALTSFGGTDWKYKESGGATARTITSKFAEIWISVKDFGAVGDGVAIDTTAVQAAMNRVKALGGGVVYFPPGEYLVDQALTLSSAVGVSLVGAGAEATEITNTHATGNCFTLTSCTDFRVESLAITNSQAATNTGIGLSLVSCTDVVISGVKITEHKFGASITGSDPENITFTGGSAIRAAAIDGTCRGIVVNPTTAGGTGGTAFNATSCLIEGSPNTNGSGIEFMGAASHCSVVGCNFGGGNVGVRFDTALTGTNFSLIGNQYPSGTPVVIEAATEPAGYYSDHSLIRATGDNDIGGNETVPTPDRSNYSFFAYRGTLNGITVTIPAPTPTPPGTGAVPTITFRLYNNTGGAGNLTAWTFNAVYHLASAASVVDTQTTVIVFKWNETRSIWQEECRAVST